MNNQNVKKKKNWHCVGYLKKMLRSTMASKIFRVRLLALG